jgi:hypothetical protein
MMQIEFNEIQNPKDKTKPSKRLQTQQDKTILHAPLSHEIQKRRPIEIQKSNQSYKNIKSNTSQIQKRYKIKLIQSQKFSDVIHVPS